MTTVLLTGASGFAGAHMLRHLLMETDYEVICPVSFRHRGHPDRIASSIQGKTEWADRTRVVLCDLSVPVPPGMLDDWATRRVKYIFNIASESHVDRSIESPRSFTENNVGLMLSVMDVARYVKPELVLHMSTDEVFGPATPGQLHAEWEPALPSNPYSASKAAQEAIGIAYWRTYGVPLVITNTMNLFGEMQDSEKYFAKVMRAVMRGDEITVHAGANGEVGSRFYIHARNFASAWLHLVRMHEEAQPLLHMYPLFATNGMTVSGRPNRYNIVGDREVSNLELALLIAETMGKKLNYRLVNFHGSRPGHDLRYALDGTKMAAAGWAAPVSFEESVRRTVRWTLDNPMWG